MPKENKEVFDFIKSEQLKNRNIQKCNINLKEELLEELKDMEALISGSLEVMFCNHFLNESVQLLINSIFLMEEGYYDCAFYSIRQSSENLNNMLFLATDKAKLEIWENKEKFPTNNQVLSALKDLNKNYKEIRNKLSIFFDEFDSMITNSHKIIHKQGFDTFYKVRALYLDKKEFNKEKEIEYFTKLLKYSICRLYIVFIILDPVGLILADEAMNRRLNFAPITSTINFNFIKNNCPYDIIGLLRKTDFYNDLVSAYKDKEEMNDDVYNVIREHYFNLNTLDNIEKQLHLLGIYELFIFYVLKLGIKVSNFHIGGISVLPFWTSEKSNYDRSSWDMNEFDKYKLSEPFNNVYKNVFISRVKVFDELFFLEHNEEFTKSQIELLQALVNEFNKQYLELKKNPK